MATRWVSLYDLLHIPKAKEAALSEDYAALYDLFHELGIDINQEIEWQDVNCRSMIDNSICFGRWVGEERTDQEWLDSRECTFENRKEQAGKKDIHLRIIMERMSEYPNFTRMAMKHMEEHWG